MNIGYFVRKDWFPPHAGSHIHTYQVVSGLSARGHSLRTLMECSDPKVVRYDPAEMREFVEDIDLLYIRIFRGLETGKHTLLRLLRSVPCPVVWEVNAPDEEHLLCGASPEEVARLRDECRRLAPLVDATVASTAALARYSASTWGIRDNHVVPLGSDPELFAPSKRDPDCYPGLGDSFKVVWAGTASYPWHGVKRIVATARRMERSEPDTVFLLIGKRKHFERFGELPRNVRIIDEVPYFEVPRYLASADLGLCLYEPDGLGVGFYRSPLKIFDYMASGLPVIASDESELRRVLGEGQRGRTVANDTEALAATIRELRDDADRRARMAAAGRRAVEDYYHWGRVAEETEAVLERLVTGRASAVYATGSELDVSVAT